MALSIVGGLTLVLLVVLRWFPSECEATGLGKDLCINLEASTLFFAIEIVLIVVTLPIVAEGMTARKWRSVRTMMIRKTVYSQSEIVLLLIEYLGQRLALGHHWTPEENGTALSSIELIAQRVRSEIDLYSIAIEPRMAEPLSKALESINTLSSLAPTIRPQFREGELTNLSFGLSLFSGAASKSFEESEALINLGYPIGETVRHFARALEEFDDEFVPLASHIRLPISQPRIDRDALKQRVKTAVAEDWRNSYFGARDDERVPEVPTDKSDLVARYVSRAEWRAKPIEEVAPTVRPKRARPTKAKG